MWLVNDLRETARGETSVEVEVGVDNRWHLMANAAPPASAAKSPCTSSSYLLGNRQSGSFTGSNWQTQSGSDCSARATKIRR